MFILCLMGQKGQGKRFGRQGGTGGISEETLGEGAAALAPSGGHAVAGQPGGVPGCRKGTLAGAGQGCSTIQQVMGGGSSLGFLWGLTAARHLSREMTCSPPGIEPWACVEGGLGHRVTGDRGTTLGLASLCPGFLT